MDLVSRNASGEETDRSKFFAQSGKVRMDSDDMSVIFLGNVFIVLDHKDQSYMVIDEAMLNQVSSQVSAAMKQMEQELAGMPPEQRAMVEQMMKGRMQGMMPDATAQPAIAPRVEVGGMGEWETYKCREHSVFLGPEKIQDICAARLGQVEGSEEIMAAFRGMAGYLKKMSESLPGPMAAGLAESPAGLMDQIDGFPVHTVQYENGEVSDETTLESVLEQDLEDDVFEAPGNYSRQDPFAGR